MYLKMDNWTKKVLQYASEYIGATPTLTIKDEEYVDVEELVGTIECLTEELEHQVEKFEEFDRQVQDNFKPITKAEQYEISDRDFI